ncbi:hypothetical protein PENTCL1PPCAC_15590 [Pristionchus entomophagus]|uniref:Nuclear receptor n=1 Tax=Pristionchus entomophagus TaxID=358040 RepID=A0AAV5TDV3_9BILA|nr:hypothetical protein PENTCL1PPCAC_15590 [Pristionchus entomophagus]
MPPLGSTKKSNRDCLVCGSPTSTAHMGIDVCRACTVFYRRSCGKKPFVCRSSTNRCTVGKGLNCKRCRLHHLELILKKSGSDEVKAAVSPTEKTVESVTEALLNHMQPSTSSSSPCSIVSTVPDDARPRPLLTRVRIAYEKMCFARLMGELFSRKDPPSPVLINSRNHPVFPATFASMNHANRLLMSCIMEFATCSFPEFDKLSDEIKWSLAVKFFYTFRMFDNSYRASKTFEDAPNRSFGSYTLWLSDDIVEHFFDDYNGANGDIEEARKIMAHNCREKPAIGRRILERTKPDEDEFLAVLTLMFWATNGLGSSDDLMRISEKYRHQIFSELHLYYRDVLHLDDYAARLGELYMFLPLFERHEEVKQTFEVFRLLDIYNDNSFTYMLNKT